MKEKIIKDFLSWKRKQKTEIKEYTKSAAGYIRVSTNKQEELSPISQLKEIWKYCEQNNIYLDLDNLFIEEDGISGKEAEKRPEFIKMIATSKIKPKPFDMIIVWKFSRFARNQEESIVYKSMLRKDYKIDVVSVSEPLVDGPFGSLIERILEWMDEFYVIRLSGEVTRGMKEKVEKGGPVTYPALGYDIKDGKFCINEDEAKIVKLIFNKFTEEKMSETVIARMLTSMKVYTKKGNTFENRNIQYILLNPVYIGKIRWTPNGKLKREEMYDNNRSMITDGNHPAIISQDQFDRARAIISKNRKFAVPHKKNDSDPYHWLKGLVRCKECNSTFVKYKDKSNDHIRCNKYNKGGCLNSTRLSLSEIESLVLNELKLIFSNQKIEINVTKIKKRKNTDIDMLDIIKNKINLNDKKLRQVKLAFEEGIDSLQEYKDNKIRLQKERNDLLKELNNFKNHKSKDKKNKKIIENAKTVYEVLTDPKIEMIRKKEIAHFLINKIIYNSENHELTLFFNDI